MSVLIVASTAMLFAVASSALMVRARMMHCRDARVPQVVEVQVIAPPAAAAAPSCGEPIVFENADGTRTVHFEACASPRLVTVDGEIQSVATPLPEHTGFAVPPVP